MRWPGGGGGAGGEATRKAWLCSRVAHEALNESESNQHQTKTKLQTQQPTIKKVEAEVKALLEGALAAAAAAVEENRALHARLSDDLARDERLDGAPLAAMLAGVQV